MLPLSAAEIYGFGKSEEFLGEFIRASGTQDKAKVATKFATLPWRFTSNSVVEACKVCNVAKELQSSHICLLVKYHALRVHVQPVLQPHAFSPCIWVQANRASLSACETSEHVLIEVTHGLCLMCERLTDVVES